MSTNKKTGKRFLLRRFTAGVTDLFAGFGAMDIVLYAAILLFCFLLFQQSDLYHTVGSSYAYLNGHFLSFYEANRAAFYLNDYLPLLYGLFATWSFPLKLFGQVTEVSSRAQMFDMTPVEIMWPKLLLVIFFFATAWVVYKAASVITAGDKERARPIAQLFITAPIPIFVVFIFGQYDIIGLFFTIVGFYFYLRKDMTRFAWFFSVAISFKYFPLAIFVPLLLLAEKRPLQLVKFGFIALVVSLVQMLLYSGSPYFRETIFIHPLLKVNEAAGSPFTVYLMLIYVGICFYTYLKKPADDSEYYKLAVFIPTAAYVTMFYVIKWNPQWLLIAMPFFVLTYIYLRHKKWCYVLDVIGMLALVWIVVNTQIENVDASMLTLGAFRAYFRALPILNSDIMSAKYLPFFNFVFYLYLLYPFLMLGLEKVGQMRIENPASDRLLFRTRFVVGVSVFVVPSLFCAFIPLSLAEKFNQQAFLRFLYLGMALYDPKNAESVGEIYGANSVVQTFKAEKEGLAAVSILFATAQRTNDVAVYITVSAEDGVEIAQHVVNGKDLKDNKYYGLRLPTQRNSKGKIYQIKITSPDGRSGNAVTAWMSKTDIYTDGAITVAGKKRAGDLMIRVFYENK
jgi:hypothetical protein